ncbi:MAG: hypothetical protein R2737_10175 [Candidatus Nanopelagicales bacterium]
MSDAAHEPAAAPAAPESDSRADIVIAVLLALVAVTTALTAWRSSVVDSYAAEATRSGLLQTVQRQTTHNVIVSEAYEQARYAASAEIETAAADAMEGTGRSSLVAEARNLRTYLIPNLAGFGGPFPSGDFLTDRGTFDVPAAIAAEEAANADYQSYDPEAQFALADDYASEKGWLTVLAIVLAMALFWLGLAEITRGRWRWMNLAVGVTLWAAAIGGFVAIELITISERGSL